MTQKTSDHLLESLSALVDGEASELELRRILKTLDEDKDLQEKWERYNLVGQVMRSEGAFNGHVDLSASVHNALASDDSYDSVSGGAEVTKEVKARATNWSSWLGKTSVAASVAAAFVFGFGQLNGGLAGVDNSGSSDVIASGAAPLRASPHVAGTLSAPLGFELPAVESRTVSATQSRANTSSNDLLRNLAAGDGFTDAQSQQLLNQLHIEHTQRASLNGGLGILPFARISKMNETVMVEASQEEAIAQ